jgi:CheY-like chemotaxis protein
LRISARGNRWKFQIADSGIGMATDQLQRIFEPFHRVESGERRVEGTGLGLAITRRLVDAMGGAIAVESEPGRGTTFTVELDLAEEAPLAEILPDQRAVIGYEGQRRSVLIADDDPASRALLADFLAGLGFAVRTAADGAAALEQLRRQPPDAIITDLVMPHVDGIELIRVARAGAVPVPRILAVSASASDYTSQEALAAGCDTFLPKPVHLADLLDRIAHLLSIRWQYADAASATRQRAQVCTDFILNRELADELRHLALLGDIAGLVDRALGQLGADPGAGAFCDELKALASDYDTGGLRRMLSAHSPR